MALHLTNTIAADRLTHLRSNDDLFVDSGRHLWPVVILVGGLFSHLRQRDPDDTTTVLLPCQ